MGAQSASECADVQRVADNGHEVESIVSTLTIGMSPPTGILTSTKPHHDSWNAYNYQRSIVTFWSQVVPNDNGCLIWTGARDNHNYGRRNSPYWHEVICHRMAWEMLRGRPAPRSSGLALDHLCHIKDLSCYGGDACPHRPCVNVDHLCERTLAENLAARRHRLTTHCRHGHEMFGRNLYVNPRTGRRTCRECVRLATRVWLDKGGNRSRQNQLRNERRAS